MTVFEYHHAGNSEAQQKAALAYLLAQSSVGKARAGVLVGLAVSQETTASKNVSVAAGAGAAQSAVIDGASVIINDTATVVDVLNANPMGGLPRNDLIVLDAATRSLRVIVGTPNAVPTDPTVPATATRLARVRNAAGATTVPASAIDDLRSFTSVGGGPYAMATGRYSHTSTIVPNSAVGPFPQTFPAGRFSVPPNLTFGIVDGSRLVAYATSVTKDGFNLYLRNVSASDSPGGVDVAAWQAVQMTPVSADG